MTLLLAEGNDRDSGAAVPSVVDGGTVRVEITGAVAEAAAAGQASVVRIESRIRGRNGFDVGSGVVIDDEGHIVTNAHVVTGTDVLRVFLPTGEEVAAILLGHDAPFTDVAVLRIAPGLASPIKPGDATALQPGDTVLAVGNPLSEFANSVSVGVVSGVNRVRTLDGFRYADLIQTDAALNNGNSGGALVNLAGQFVGMPTAVIRESIAGDPVAGIGFAIPAQHVLEIASAIITRGAPIERADLGIGSVEITADVVRAANLPTGTEGVLVTEVLNGGPAGTAGILPGDVLKSIDGLEIGIETPLLNALVDKEPEQTVTVLLDRKGSIVETRVRLGRRS